VRPQDLTRHDVIDWLGRPDMSVGSTATAHELRDTCATRTQRQVRDIRVTQQLLRHRSIKSTQKYTKLAASDIQAAVSAMTWLRDEPPSRTACPTKDRRYPI
jgi:site-specific recombinase XerD